MPAHPPRRDHQADADHRQAAEADAHRGGRETDTEQHRESTARGNRDRSEPDQLPPAGRVAAHFRRASSRRSEATVQFGQPSKHSSSALMVPL